MRLKGILILAALVSLPGRTTLAWDQHHFLTSQLLTTFKTRDPKLWQKLNTPVTVTPIEEFLAKAINPSCTWTNAKSSVFGGVGRDYQVLYTSGVNYLMQFTSDDWAKGISRTRLQPIVDAKSALGVQVRPLDVLATYSDEPDWGLDDDVPELKGKGLSQSTEGTSTRLLRHFWYEGQDEMGFDLSKDQETDRRAQLYYELALTAFSFGEPYWGYRFLADALHYIQDITQPFHTKAIINKSMVDTLAVVRAKLCEWSKNKKDNPDCGPDMTVDAQVIRSSCIMGSYHAAYEDFARGLMAPRFPHQSYVWINDFDGQIGSNVEKMPWTDAKTGPLMDLTQVIRAEQRAINAFSDSIGKNVYNVLGWGQRYDLTKTQAAILATGKDSAPGYELASANTYGPISGMFGADYTQRQLNAIPALVDATHQVFLRAGVWSREFISQTLESLDDASALKAITDRRAAFEKKCAAAPSL